MGWNRVFIPKFDENGSKNEKHWATRIGMGIIATRDGTRKT